MVTASVLSYGNIALIIISWLMCTLIANMTEAFRIITLKKLYVD